MLFRSTAVGWQALNASTVSYNTALGSNALGLNTTGNLNTAVGNGCLVANTTGVQNVGVGYRAGASNTTGSSNVAVGCYAADGANGGNSNVSVGYGAGYVMTNGSGNVLIGYQAGYNGTNNITSGQNNIIIGVSAGAGSATANNQIVMGAGINGNGAGYFTFGQVSNTVYNQFTLNASWTRSSDVRLKTDIQDDTIGLAFIEKVKPRTFKWKSSKDVPQELTRHYSEEETMDTESVMNGFIAQEVKEALDAGNYGAQGVWSVEPDGTQAVSREMFITPLINAVKELSARVKELEAKVNGS